MGIIPFFFKALGEDEQLANDILGKKLSLVLSSDQNKAIQEKDGSTPKYNEWSEIIGIWESYALRLGSPIEAKRILKECSFSWIAKAIGNQFIYGQ